MVKISLKYLKSSQYILILKLKDKTNEPILMILSFSVIVVNM